MNKFYGFDAEMKAQTFQQKFFSTSEEDVGEVRATSKHRDCVFWSISGIYHEYAV